MKPPSWSTPKAFAVAPLGSKSESWRDRAAELLLEGRLRPARVGRDRVQRRAALRELVEDLFIEGQLVVADRAERERVEDEDARLTEQILLAELLAVLGLKRELGDFAPRFDDAHLRRPSDFSSSR